MRVGAAELDAERAVVAHFDGVGAHALLAEHALAGRLTSNFQLCHAQVSSSPSSSPWRQPVALVRAGLVEGVDAGAVRTQAHSRSTVDLDQLHRADREIGEIADRRVARSLTSMVTSARYDLKYR